MQEKDHELTQQLAATAGGVVAMKSQLAASQAEAGQLRAQMAQVRDEHRRVVLRLEDQVT